MMQATKVTNLRLKFPGTPELQFKDLTLGIERGEKVLLLGPSGCGKSTLLQVLTGLIPHSIEVPIKYDELIIPNSWSFVFQDPDTQFCMPYVDEELAFVLENLQVPHDRMPALIDEYLQQVGLRLEDRHTPISSLSQGMKQRLAIASAIALQPDVLLLDEPTALLDPEGTTEVWETIKRLAEDKTLIVVEHKIDHIIDLIDRIVLFNASGEIIADGPRDHIFTRYKEEIIRYGIWYPGVWQDYVNSPDYAAAGRNNGERAPGQATRSGETVPLIEMQHFLAYRGKRPTTSVVSGRIMPGDWVTIVGRNGAGKSTLLLGLMQLVKTKGEYRIMGQPIDSLRDLSDLLAFVFQNPEFQFVTNRVWDEIAYTLRLSGAAPDEIQRKVDGLLQQFALAAQRDQHPYQLSTGQKRRLSVASAVVKEQPILLLDEPTFGQDAQNTFAILKKLEDWRLSGGAIIMVTHDLNIVRHFATQVWHVHDGLVDLYGDPEDYFTLMSEETPEQSTGLTCEEVIWNETARASGEAATSTETSEPHSDTSAASNRRFLDASIEKVSL